VRIDLSDVGRTRDEDEALVHLEAAQVADVAGRLLERNEDLEVVKVFNENGEEEEVGSEVEERVTIRSLEEKVAVGGKNFSGSKIPSASYHDGVWRFEGTFDSMIRLVPRTDSSLQARASDSFSPSRGACSSSAHPPSSSWTSRRRISTT
jgi:hypothetical protein